jgi:hypothetical protein
MQSAQVMKEKAAQCRRLARQHSIRRFAAKGSNYLLVLADRYEREAAKLIVRAVPGNSNGRAV